MEKKHTEPRLKFIINDIKDQIQAVNDLEIHLDARSWGSEEGILLTGNEAKVLINNHYQLLEALKEANETITWMWENFSIDDKNNQSDAFNIPANTIAKIEEAIKKAEA